MPGSVAEFGLGEYLNVPLWSKVRRHIRLVWSRYMCMHRYLDKTKLSQNANHGSNQLALHAGEAYQRDMTT